MRRTIKKAKKLGRHGLFLSRNGKKVVTRKMLRGQTFAQAKARGHFVKKDGTTRHRAPNGMRKVNDAKGRLRLQSY